MRISDWSSDVCSSDLGGDEGLLATVPALLFPGVAAAHRQRQLVGELVVALGEHGGRPRLLRIAEKIGGVVPCGEGKRRRDQVLEAQDLRNAEVNLLPLVESARNEVERPAKVGREAQLDRKSTRLNSSH